METITCKSKEEAIKLLQNAKEFFQNNIDGKIDSTVVAFYLSFIDKVQDFMHQEYKE